MAISRRANAVAFLLTIGALAGCGGSRQPRPGERSTAPAATAAPAVSSTPTTLGSPTAVPPVVTVSPGTVSLAPAPTTAPVTTATAPVTTATTTPPAPPSFEIDIEAPYWSAGPVYVACDLALNGQAPWTPNGFALTQDATIPTRWRASIATIGTMQVTAGTTIHWKLTRGSWDKVEKGPQGDEVPDRVAVCGSGPTRVLGHVFHWADDTMFPPANAIRDLQDWTPRELNTKRWVCAHLPPGYFDPANANKRYPVVYALDGQGCFDKARTPKGVVLGLDVISNDNVAKGHGAYITIAIDNTMQRVDEYAPSYDPVVMGGGQLPAFARWLLEELKPEVDRIYRTDPAASSTAILGTELGALAAFHVAWNNPDKVGMVAALSAPMTWNMEETRALVAATANKPTFRLWLDVGTNEAPSPQLQLDGVRHVKDALVTLGFAVGNDLEYREVAGGTADESSWAARLPEVMGWLFR